MDINTHMLQHAHTVGFCWWLSSKESTCNAADSGSNPGREEPWKKEMATHSIILARKIPWTEKPGGLQSMGSQRIGHN